MALHAALIEADHFLPAVWPSAAASSAAPAAEALPGESTRAGQRVRHARIPDALLRTLLAGVAARDRGAFERLYRATSRPLYAVAVRLLRRAELADETLQDAFVRIWENAGDFDPARAAPMAWLVAIVRHRALDLLRRPLAEGRWSSTDAGPDDDDGPLAAVSSDEPDPLDALADARSHERLARALAALPGHYRQALSLAYMSGLAHPDIAARLEVPLGTAKSWVRRGAEQLRRSLA